VERVVLNALVKVDAALPPDCQCAGRSPRISSAPDTDRFERATLRRSVSDEGENSTSPAIKFSVSNFPLNTNVPGSRPKLPIGNSIAPGVKPVFPEKNQAIRYAENRASFRSGEIRILDSAGKVKWVIPFSEAGRKL